MWQDALQRGGETVEDIFIEPLLVQTAQIFLNEFLPPQGKGGEIHSLNILFKPREFRIQLIQIPVNPLLRNVYGGTGYPKHNKIIRSINTVSVN